MNCLRLVTAFMLVVAVSVLAPPATAAPVTGPVGPAWDAPHAVNEPSVKLPLGETPATLRGGTRVLREIPELGLALVQPLSSTGLMQAAADLAETGSVEWAELHVRPGSGSERPRLCFTPGAVPEPYWG